MMVIIRLAAVLIAVALALFSVGSASAQSRATMRVSTVTPEDHPASRVLRQVAERLNGRADLNLVVEVFPGAVLGGDVETLDQVARGAIQGTVAGGGTLLQPYNPKFALEELPFLFPSREAAYKGMDGKLGQTLASLAEKHGFVILSYWENGFRHFTNSKRPIRTPADMTGLRFRSAEVAIRLDMFRALKASAVPMPFPELYQALQQGVVDGQENPISLISTAGLHTVQKHLSLSGHVWNSLPVIVSKEWFEALPKNVQAAVREEFYNARVEERAAIEKADTELLGQLKQKGMQVSEIDKAAFQKATDAVWTMYEKRIGEDLMAMAREARDSAPK